MPKTGTLTKARIVEAVKETNGYTQQKAFETVEIMLELIKRSLEVGEDVLISSFGMHQDYYSLRWVGYHVYLVLRNNSL
jgi:hypothetical protein